MSEQNPLDKQAVADAYYSAQAFKEYAEKEDPEAAQRAAEAEKEGIINASTVVPVDESRFKNMETVAVAQGPDAERRRMLMATWAEHQGALAEDAQRAHVETENKVGSNPGTPLWMITKNAERTAKEGEVGKIPINPDNHQAGYNKVIRKATEDGVVVANSKGPRLYRSPSKMR